MPQRIAGVVKARARADGRGATGDSAALLRVLTLHQQELEAQNQELRRVQGELCAARDRYRDLFDNAPVGYCTLDARGRLVEVNRTAAAMLAEPEARLVGMHLSALIAPADAERWHRHRQQAMQQRSPQPIALRLQRRDGTGLHCQLDCLAVAGGDAAAQLRVALTDLTPGRQADADRQAALHALAAQEAERRRVSRALHDDLGQRLSVAKMELAAWLPESPTRHPLLPLLGALDEAVAIVRRMASELRPLMLDDLGLCAAIETLARDAAREQGLQLELSLAADAWPLVDQHAVILYRVLQQALSLLAQPTGVRVVGVTLGREAAGAVLTVYNRVAKGRRAVPSDPAGTRWRALCDAGPLLGYTLAHEPMPDGECVRVSLAAGATAAGASR